MPAISTEFLIDEILPAREIHLLGGSSGSGKTTFLFQLLADWQEGNPVLGHTSYPVPYAYISIDRSRTSVTRTLQRIGLENKITRVICREDLPSHVSLGSVLDAAKTILPDTEVFFIEGFQTLVGDKGNSYTPVAALLQQTTTYCARENVTIVGVCHSPKLRMEEGFQHPREIILGSVAWAAFSDTVITLNLEEKTGVITVSVMPRNAPSEQHYFVFSPPNGILIPPTNTPKALLIQLVLARPMGDDISRQQIIEWADGLGASESSAERAIREMLSDGDLVPTMQRGVYRRADSPAH